MKLGKVYAALIIILIASFFFYFNYPSGTGLVRGAVMGRIAGAEAAANV